MTENGISGSETSACHLGADPARRLTDAQDVAFVGGSGGGYPPPLKF